MPNIYWNKAFSVGSPEIDDQHKKWFDLYNTMRINTKKYGRNVSDDLIEKSIEALHDYSRSHFKFEERYMEKIGYREIEAHKREHMVFDEKISAFRDAFSKKTRLLDQDLLDFIKNWLIEHVSRTDKKYSVRPPKDS